MSKKIELEARYNTMKQLKNAVKFASKDELRPSFQGVLAIGINGGKFDTSKPAFASFWTNIDGNGNQVVSTLHFTGRSAIREEFGETFTEFEMVDDGGGVNYVSEADLYQR